ncbi:MAG: Lrp/AsnC ligand binding domain-containing protein [Rhodobacteraceae bacterium]|nr:Lrp/AsnC ligand binding domain-containing protein [Paracoccaceae bacterium]
MSRELDKIDSRILNELQANGRLSIVELASRINLTNTPCSERVRRLEKSGIIKKYCAVLDPNALGYSHLSVVQISMAATANSSLDDFNTAVQEVDEIESCLMIAGSFDYVLIVRTRDMAHFRIVLGEQISKLPGIRQTNSFAVMEVVKEAREIDVKPQS